MTGLHHKARWVLSPMKAGDVALASEYALQCVPHLVHDGACLAWCLFNAQGLLAARACPDLHVWPSLHSGEPVHPRVVEHYGGHGVEHGMSHHEALLALARHHPSFEPEV